METTLLIKKINNSELKQQLVSIMRNLQQLRLNGLDDKEIEKVFMDLQLPLKPHLFIMGNYSQLIMLKYGD